MNYIKVHWIHSLKDEPIWIYCELDDQRWEVRKVEVFAENKMGYAKRNKNSSNPLTLLGEKQVPPLLEIARDPQFDPMEITKEEFEAIWTEATR